jgi:tetratricopeptide (TPR) repeat protein
MNDKLEKLIAELISSQLPADLDALLVAVKEQAQKTGNPSDFETQIHLANELKRAGRYEEAKRIYDLLLKGSHGESSERAAILNNLAALLQDVGDYEQALALYHHSLEIARRVLGPEHPSVATTLNNLAAVYEAKGDYEQALALYHHSLEIARRVLGSNHPDTARILSNSAGVLLKMKRIDEARRRYEEAMQVMEQYLGKDNRFSLMIKANLKALGEATTSGAQQSAPADARTSRR